MTHWAFLLGEDKMKEDENVHDDDEVANQRKKKAKKIKVSIFFTTVKEENAEIAA